MKATGDLVVGIDIGTSGIKCGIWTAGGRLLASDRAATRVTRPVPAFAEQDAVRDWWDTICALTARLLGGGDQGEPVADRVAAVCVSGICPVLVPVDRDGTPLRNAILYSIDQRAADEIDHLRKTVGDDTALHRSGQILRFSNLLAKLLWLRRHEPTVAERMAYFLGSTGYAVFRLTGAATVDHFSAADGGLGYDLARHQWDWDLITDLGLDPSLFPRLMWPTEIAGTVTRDASAQTGLRAGIPVLVGTGDALADLIGTGAPNRDGAGAILYGTSISTMVYSKATTRSDRLVTVPGISPDQTVVSAVLPTGVGALEWVARRAGLRWTSQWGAAVDLLIEGITDVFGLVFLPYFSGRRTAAGDGLAAGGTLVGLSMQHEQAHLVRAAVTGLAFALRDELSHGDRVEQLIATGGGTGCRSLLQAVSDICDFTQRVDDGAAGAAAKGAAALAIRSIDAAVKSGPAAAPAAGPGPHPGLDRAPQTITPRHEHRDDPGFNRFLAVRHALETAAPG